MGLQSWKSYMISEPYWLVDKKIAQLTAL